MTSDWLQFWQEVEELPELTHPQRVLFEAKAWSAGTTLIVNHAPRILPERAARVRRSYDPHNSLKARCPHCKTRVLTFESIRSPLLIVNRQQPRFQVNLYVDTYGYVTCDCGAEVKLEPLMEGGYIRVLIGFKSTRDRLRDGSLDSSVIFNEAFDMRAYIDRRLATMIIERLVKEAGRPSVLLVFYSRPPLSAHSSMLMKTRLSCTVPVALMV